MGSKMADNQGQAREVPISSKFSTKIVEWCVEEGKSVQIGTVLCRYERSGQSGANSGFIAQPKLKSPCAGLVSKLLVAVGDDVRIGAPALILEQEHCEHKTVMKDMCCDCGADLRREPGIPGNLSAVVAASVPLVHNVPELRVSVDEAEMLARKDEERLLKTKKLTLVVDLDQTLIHTTTELVPKDIKDVYHFQLPGHSIWYHTKFRPGAIKFLQSVAAFYELHIFTMGSRMYAHKIARMLDPDESLFSHRIRSRDECFDPTSKVLDLSALFPGGDSMVCIIDDREDVWNFVPNLITVKPYRYFTGVADINAIPGKEAVNPFNEEPDMHTDNIHTKNVTVLPSVGNNCEGTDNEEVLNKADDSATRTGKRSADEIVNNVTKRVKIVDENSSELSVDQTTLLKEIEGENDAEGNRNSLGEMKKEKRRTEIMETCSVSQTQEGVLSKMGITNTNPIKCEKSFGEGDIFSCKAQENVLDDSSLVVVDITKDTMVTEDMEVNIISGMLSKCQENQGDVSLNENKKDTGENSTSQDNSVEVSQKDLDNRLNCEETISRSGSLESGEISSDSSNDVTSEVKITKDLEEGVSIGNSEDAQVAVEGEEIDAESEENKMNISCSYHEDDDDYLMYLEDILKRIHSAFYTTLERIKEIGEMDAINDPGITKYCAKGTLEVDCKVIVQELKRSTLHGVNMVLTGVIPTNVVPQESHIWRLIQSLGANVSHEITTPKDSSTDDGSDVTTHVVAARLGTEKAYKAVKSQWIHLVSPQWFWCCAERWEHVDEDLFPVDGIEKYKMKYKHMRTPQSSRRNTPNNKPKKNNEAEGMESLGDKVLLSGGVETDTRPGVSDISTPSTSADELMSTLNPLLSFSSDDVEAMDKEVEELMNSSSDSDVLGSVSGSSSSSSESSSSSSSSSDSDSSDSEKSSMSSPSLSIEGKRRKKHVKRKDRMEEDANDGSSDEEVKGTRKKTLVEKFKADEVCLSELSSAKAESDSEDDAMAALLEENFLTK